MPLALLLHEAGITDETGFNQHHVSRLQHALQVRRIPLHQRQHIAQPFQ
jgi:hypothetical protein